MAGPAYSSGGGVSASGDGGAGKGDADDGLEHMDAEPRKGSGSGELPGSSMEESGEASKDIVGDGLDFMDVLELFGPGGSTEAGPSSEMEESLFWDEMAQGTMEQTQPQRRRVPKLQAQRKLPEFRQRQAAVYDELLQEVWADVRSLVAKRFSTVWPPWAPSKREHLEADAAPGLLDAKRYPGLDRLKYKLERAIWSDVGKQYGLLLVTVTAIALFGGTVYASVTGEELLESLWHAQLFVLDSGSLSEVDDTPARFIGFVLTIAGLLLVSVLVGIMSQTIERRVAAVTSQVTRVLETDHIVVLHWNASAQRLVRELQMGNRDVEHNMRNNTIVVLAEESRQVMSEACREAALQDGDMSDSDDVLCMEGSPLMVSSLELISACRARTIIILAPGDSSCGGPTSAAAATADLSISNAGDDADATALCTMLALTSLASSMDMRLPRVIMEVHSAETVGLVRRTFGDSVYPILVGAIAAKMTVQSILMPGISRVFRNLLSFKGSEFYFLPVPPSLVGVAYGELSQLVKHGIPVGLYQATGLNLLPKASTQLRFQDRIVLLQPTSRSTEGFDSSRASVDISMDEVFVSTSEIATDLSHMPEAAEPHSHMHSQPPEGMPADAEHSSSPEDTAVQWQALVPPSTSLPAESMPLTRTRQSTSKAMHMLFQSLDLDIDLGFRKDAAKAKDRESQGAGNGAAGRPAGGHLLTGAILIAGWRPGMGRIVKTIDDVMRFGSEVHILSEVPFSERDGLLVADGLDLDYIYNVKIRHFLGRPGRLADLRQLPVPEKGYTAAALLADWRPGSARPSRLDAARIKSALLLRDFLWRRMLKHGRKNASTDNFTYFVTEVSGAGTDMSLPISDFVEVGALDVYAISQVVFQPALHELQIQLLNTGEGVHLTLEPSTCYCTVGDIMSFQDISRNVQFKSRGMSLAIGYKVDQEVFINPPRSALVMWEEHHELVMLNRVRKRTEEKERQEELARKQRRRTKMLQKALGRSGSFSASFEGSLDDGGQHQQHDSSAH